jgi:2-C-methyl-D-erythritol 4-phosphate cytidylyltransferase
MSHQPDRHTFSAAVKCYALVPAAGSGSRAETALPKQYAPLAGLPMVARTLTALDQVARLHATLVVLAPDDDRFEAHVPGFAGARSHLSRSGGATRAESVARGLEQLLHLGAGPQDWVLVHDAARCLLNPHDVERLIQACLPDRVGGLLALPVADTLKASRDGRAVATVDRSDKWVAQTPQMFRIGMLREALAMAGSAVTDEASAIELLGHAPLLVRGDPCNLKITWPQDFILAEQLLRARLHQPSQEVVSS